MALVTIATDGGAEQPVISGVISLPRVGVWHAELRVDSEIDFDSAAVTISVNGGELDLVGVVTRALQYEGVNQVRIVGGAAGMQRSPTPKFYGGSSVGPVLADIAGDVGETISDADSGGVTEGGLHAWTTIRAPAGRQLTELLRPIAGAVWRILPDGSLWAGIETWPVSEVGDDDWQPLAYDHWNGVLELGMLSPTLQPGTTLGSDKVRIDRVEHRIDRDSVRTFAWVPRDNRLGAGGEQDTAAPRLDRDFAAVGRGAMTPFDFLALYAGTVKGQKGQTFQVQPDDERLPIMSDLPVRNGIPGMEVTVSPGAQILIGWRNGDPREPYCALWGGAGGDATTKIILKVDELLVTSGKIQLGADLLQPATEGVVLGQCPDPFTGATHFALGGASTVVMAKKG
jgi:hypothetical protein